MSTNLQVLIYESPQELVAAATNNLFQEITTHLTENSTCHIALTGGNLGNEIARSFVSIVNQMQDVSGLHLWYSDERFEQLSSPLRNSLPVRENLTNKSVVFHEVKPPNPGFTVVDAATQYANELSGIVMDVCILGVGEDGHVASLFNPDWNPEEKAKVISIQNSPKPPPQRVTFSMPFINSSSKVWLVTAGKTKKEVVGKILTGDQSIPAANIAPKNSLTLFVDDEAAPLVK